MTDERDPATSRTRPHATKGPLIGRVPDGARPAVMIPVPSVGAQKHATWRYCPDCGHTRKRCICAQD